MTKTPHALLLLALSSWALATEPATVPAAPSTTASNDSAVHTASPAQGSTAANATSAAKAPTATASDATTGDQAIDPNEDRRLRNLGYKPEKLRGETVYCRNEQPVGSRLAQKNCTTAARHGDLTRESQEMIEHIQRNVSNKPQ